MKLPNGDFSELDMKVMKPFLEGMVRSDNYLEIGVKYGRSLAFASKNTLGRVYGIDIVNTNTWEADNTMFINKPSNEAVKEWDKPLEILFIDGDHTYEGVKDDWDNFYPFVVKGGNVLFHDCDETSPGVVQLANEVANKNGWDRLTLYKDVMGNTSMASIRRLK